MDVGFDRKKKYGGRPRALICYICGRQYGTNSLKIHLKQCAKLWEDREALKPKHDRRSVPEPPKAFTAAFERAKSGKKSKNISNAQIEAQNRAAFNAYNDTSLFPCPHCGRTFLEEPLARHLKVCRPDSIIGKKLKGGSGLAGGNLGKGANPADGGVRRKTRPRTTSPRQNSATVPSEKPWHRKTRGKGGNAPPKTSPQILIATKNKAGQAEDSFNTDLELSKFLKEEGISRSVEWNVRENAYNKVDAQSAAGAEDTWEKATDPKTGRPFYVHSRTGKRRWTKPSSNSSSSTPRAESGNPNKTSRAGSIWTPPEALSETRPPLVTSSTQGSGQGEHSIRLEARVSVLEEQLAGALQEINRLKNILGNFQRSFNLG